MNRTTLANPFRVQGVGLFTGAATAVDVKPRVPTVGDEPGYWFRRVDVPTPVFAGTIDRVVPGLGVRNTTLGVDVAGAVVTIATVEHLLSALVGMGISDALIEVDGPEIPLGDGSAEPFATAIRNAGSTGTNVPMVEIDVPTAGAGPPVRHVRSVRRQTPGWTFRYTTNYPVGSGVPSTTCVWDATTAGFESQIAPARTFALEAEARQMRAAGLFPHLAPSQALVIRPDGSPLSGALRFRDECCRHKLLDLIGDLALLGRPLRADIEGIGSGHETTHELCRAVWAAMG
jgi:UDP-3-O-acyl-N-acetylglucosamine deacetylase